LGESNKPQIEISVVIPVFNEEECICELYARLKSVMNSLSLNHEIVYVDDGSVDSSWDAILQLSQQDESVVALKLSRNFGHHVAIGAGLDVTAGDWVVVMDADLQDLPEEIPKLYACAMEGHDVVMAARKGRKHGVFKQFSGRLFAKIISRLGEFDYDPEVGVFRVMSRRVVRHVCGLREVARFFTGLVYWVGFSQVKVDVKHGDRHAGETKYDFSRQLSLAFNGIISFTEKPLKLAVYAGAVFALSGILYACVIAARALMGDIAVLGYASLMSAILLVGGVTISSIGLLGLYVGRIFAQVKSRPLYILAEAKNVSGAADRAYPLLEGEL